MATGLDGQIYALGGSGFRSAPQSEVWAYDPCANTWTKKAPMPTARYWFQAAAGRDGKIYAIGGIVTHPDGTYDDLATVEAYDPTTNTWSGRASMPTPREALQVVLGSDGLIYATGGLLKGQLLAVHEAYDPTTNTWTKRAPMPTARSFVDGVTASDGRIYAIGGQAVGASSIIKKVEIYDPNANTWTAGPDVPQDLYGAGSVVAYGGRIFTFAFGSKGNPVQIYDVNAGTWSLGAAVPPMSSEVEARLGATGRIYRVSAAALPAGQNFAVYDPNTNTWTH
jgi:N-acetylneuraminic acid mutarotase